MSGDVRKWEEKDQEIVGLLLKSEEENKKMQNKVMYLEGALAEQEGKLREETQVREKVVAEKSRLERVEEELNGKLRGSVRDYAGKVKEIEELNNQLAEVTGAGKKKVGELMEKNRGSTSRTQE